MAEKKEKQYVSDNARLMAEWDFEPHELRSMTASLRDSGE